jgi:hypothetical protein
MDPDFDSLLQSFGTDDPFDARSDSFLAYYHEWRTHPSLDKNARIPRAVQLPACGTLIHVPHVGGLHHHYGRRAA